MKQEEIEVLSSALKRAISSPDQVADFEEIKLFFSSFDAYLASHPMDKGRVAEIIGRVALSELLRRVGNDFRAFKAVFMAAYPRPKPISASVPGAHGPGDGPATSGPSSTSGARDDSPKH